VWCFSGLPKKKMMVAGRISGLSKKKKKKNIEVVQKTLPVARRE
jgi:hypothetical protein